ncbi:hypothetical protein KPP03845_107123 [Streptomyces xanthophaeus]|nr:hypothetical protein KPP03845_107123 [Streptomyces xanthophaeus]
MPWRWGDQSHSAHTHAAADPSGSGPVSRPAAVADDRRRRDRTRSRTSGSGPCAGGNVLPVKYRNLVKNDGPRPGTFRCGAA